ncbi:MAG: hypothetical protein C7B43_14555 [Sulfobacillus benefaciens]|jgi:hypothetical protein|uniref:Uncharacterized protein n=1 Tax=Sulfobacillus benefaciens TaxID=453960 RepID=A0A2T2WVB0_9FIRM|nr:MAG: hypothetical protein C7B43_14555 [Sulfobacillus benefaciens]
MTTLTQALDTARQGLQNTIQEILVLSPESLHEWQRLTHLTWSDADPIPAGLTALGPLVEALSWVATVQKSWSVTMEKNSDHLDD